MENNRISPRLTRRQLLQKAMVTGTSILSVCGAGYWFSRRYSAQPGQHEPSVALPDFSVASKAGRLVVAKGSDRRSTLRKAMAALGGLEHFIRPGDRVLLKVNAAFASSPMVSATTHPDLVSELTALCLTAGAGQVLVADNPINDPSSCFALTGIGPAVKKAGGQILVPGRQDFKPVRFEGAVLLDGWPVFITPLEQADKLIGIAPIKDHHRSGASMIMKNWYGLLGGRRNVLHQDIHTTIAELAMMVKPTLVVLDGTTTMMANGPTGGSLSDLKQTDTIIVSTDQVAADAFGAQLLEKNSRDFPFIGKAARAGAGTEDFQSLKPITV